jgi:hypothetical protein
MSTSTTSTQSRFGGKPAGQHDPLTRRLQNLIQQYPNSPGILKEFLQNADDAGASKVIVLLDRRTFLGDRLPGPEMQTLMGPALLIYNDAPFSDQDLVDIQEIGYGGKLDNPTKTGRFGLGFNAAYNITDYPHFVSRSTFMIFDPHCNAVTPATPAAPGWQWELDELWSQHGDLLTPFRVFGLEPGDQSYPYTIFRLPLRTTDQAARSEISNQPFTTDQFDQILAHIKQHGHEWLLFLKHVLHFEIREIADGMEAPKSLLTFETVNADEVLSWTLSSRGN